MLVILMAALAVAADDKPAPSKEPPRIVKASIKDDKLVVHTTVTVSVPVTVVEKVKTKEGKELEVTKTMVKSETRTVEQSYDLKKATATTAGGKKISLDDLKKKLEKPQAIVLSADGNAIDESYLKLFDKDVIVIVVPMPRMDVVPFPQPVTPPPPPPPVKEKKEKD